MPAGSSDDTHSKKILFPERNRCLCTKKDEKGEIESVARKAILHENHSGKQFDAIRFSTMFGALSFLTVPTDIPDGGRYQSSHDSEECE